MTALKKVMVFGSGGIKIAEAAEFDYSGSQALKALKEEGIMTVLVNPNVASVQTSSRVADRVHFIPLQAGFVTKLIEEERPDGVMLGFGGQSALSLGVSLYDAGVFDRYGVRVLGTPVSGIKSALSRELFRELMIKIGEPVPESETAHSMGELIEAARRIGLPLMVRVSFNLGGRGSAVVHSYRELEEVGGRAFAQSAIGEVIVEKYLDGWKEIEYEIMRDGKGNRISVACLENLDPMGVHTGESVVIAPNQTIANDEFQVMRNASFRVAESIGLVGECNVQTSLQPDGKRYYVIETNPRMSRSSALASKATGYPLAYIAAKLALGYSLAELKNPITEHTTAFFEPSLDYVAIKIPRWDLQKFYSVDSRIATEMKSIGEVLALGRSFEEAFNKAIRMLDLPNYTYLGDYAPEDGDELELLRKRRAYWFFYAARAFAKGETVETVSKLTKVDPFFLEKLKKMVEAEDTIAKEGPSFEMLSKGKKLGLSDRQLASLWSTKEEEVERLRRIHKVQPVVRCVDTLAGEWPLETNYLYLSYDGSQSETGRRAKRGLAVVGAGVFRIGVSVEFDWGVVNVVDAAKRTGLFDRVVIFNYNPETVSTDWDTGDTLLLDELTPESVRAGCDLLGIEDVVCFAGGQIANNMIERLHKMGLRIVGSNASSVGIAENRKKFSEILDRLGIPQPEWTEATDLREALKFADRVGYPVLVRPSYVLSGSSMTIAMNEEELENFILKATKASPEHPVVVSKFIEGALEGEVDAVGTRNGILAALLEHIEEGGVHSGDATIVTPSHTLGGSTYDISRILESLVAEIDIKGPFNLQFLVKNNTIYVIELNLRLSRSMPFTSKTYGVNLAELGLKAALDIAKLRGIEFMRSQLIGVKSPQFSWSQLKGAYPHLGPEMRSTGEVAAFAKTLEEALYKSWLGAPPNRVPDRNSWVLAYSRVQTRDAIAACHSLQEQGYRIVTFDRAPLGTFERFTETELIDAIKTGRVQLLITEGFHPDLDMKLRREMVDRNIPVVLSFRLASALAKSFETLLVDQRSA
jgi:carbamoyl-phosphate synthase large subunit